MSQDHDLHRQDHDQVEVRDRQQLLQVGLQNDSEDAPPFNLNTQRLHQHRLIFCEN